MQYCEGPGSVFLMTSLDVLGDILGPFKHKMLLTSTVVTIHAGLSKY